jgi:hypothetical protein
MERVFNMPNSRQIANNNARKIIEKIVTSSPGPFETVKITAVLHKNHKSRSFSPRRVAPLLRERKDLKWVRAGVFEKVPSW